MENYRKRKQNLSESSLKRYDTLFSKYGKKILEEDTDKWFEFLEEKDLSTTTKRLIYTSIMYNLFDQDISDKKKKDIYDTVREELDKTLKKEAAGPSNNVELKYEYDQLEPKKPLTNVKNELLFKLYTKQIPRRKIYVTFIKVVVNFLLRQNHKFYSLLIMQFSSSLITILSQFNNLEYIFC